MDTFEEYGEHIQNLWLQSNKWAVSLRAEEASNQAVCRISRIEEDCFMELSTLEWLKLNNNELRSLPYTLMEPVLMSLKYIDVYSECHGIIIFVLDILT